MGFNLVFFLKMGNEFLLLFKIAEAILKCIQI